MMSTPAVIFIFVMCIILIERLMGVFFDKRRTPFLIMAGSYLLYFSTSIIVYFSSAPTPIHIMLDALLLFVITLNYKSSKSKKVLAVLSCLLFLATYSALTAAFYRSPASHLGWLDYYAFNIIMFGFLPFLLVSLLRRATFIKKHSMPLATLGVYALLVAVIFIFSVVFHLSIYHAPDLPQFFAISSLAVALIIIFLIFYLHNSMSKSYDSRLKSALHAQEKDYYFSQSKLMQESVEKIKAIRHDIKVHLATVRDNSTDNQFVTDYIDRLLGDIRESETYSNTGNIAFDSIINYKLGAVEENSIDLHLKVSVPQEISIEATDIVTILGNLLDNALEALDKVDGNKMLRLNIKYENSGVLIKIENSFIGEVKYSGKTGEERQITTLKSGDGHGYGLKNIRQAVEKYNGYMKIAHEDDVFSVLVFLYVDEV